MSMLGTRSSHTGKRDKGQLHMKLLGSMPYAILGAYNAELSWMLVFVNISLQFLKVLLRYFGQDASIKEYGY